VTFAIGTDDGQTVLKNHAKVEFDKNIGTRIGEIYSQIDKDIKEIINEDKPSDMKTYEYVKQKMTELKDLKAGKGGDEALKAEIAKLKKDLEDGGSGKHWQEKFEAGVAQWTAKEKELNDTLANVKADVEKSTIKSFLATGLPNIKLNKNIPQAAQQSILDGAMNELMQHAQLIEGKVVLQKKTADGYTAWLNEKYEPINASDALGTLLKDMLDTKKSTGGGADTSDVFGKVQLVGEGDKAKKTIKLDKTKIKTRVDFTEAIEEALIANGVVRGTKDWDSITMETREEMGIASLPLN
jgi:hypothetical protein